MKCSRQKRLRSLLYVSPQECGTRARETFFGFNAAILNFLVIIFSVYNLHLHSPNETRKFEEAEKGLDNLAQQNLVPDYLRKFHGCTEGSSQFAILIYRDAAPLSQYNNLARLSYSALVQNTLLSPVPLSRSITGQRRIVKEAWWNAER